jgi:HK97 family phage major capsid protein
LALLVNDRRRLTGWAADPMVEPLLMGSVDNNGRPILVDTNAEGISQRLLGRPVGFGEGVSGVEGDSAIRLVGGDFRKVAYGVGSAISYSVSTEATVTLPDNSVIYLWQQNMVALLAEAEYGLVINDVEDFVTFDDGTGSS